MDGGEMPAPKTIVTEAGGPAESTLELAAGLRLVVMRLARRLRQRADAGVTPSMLSAMSSIGRLGPITLGDLAAAEQIQPPSLSAIVGRLEQEGLVVREPDPSDRRVARVRLSSWGRRLVERSRSRKTAYLARRLLSLSSEDRDLLRRVIPVVERILEDGA
jgi:DNA-binding MarR family transcriptional regulator